MARVIWLVPALLVALLGCGSGQNEALVVDPADPVVHVGERLPLSASAQEELQGEPEWELLELHGGGLLKSQGWKTTYIAPASAGTYHLVLRGTRTGGTRIKVVQQIVVLPQPSIEPASAEVAQGASQSFTVRMKGLPRNTATWAVEEPGGGSVSPEGVYAAPAQPGTYHVTATSALDPRVSVTATVRVD